jgi:hypothetical protein
MDQRKIIVGRYQPHFEDQQVQLVLLALMVKMEQVEIQQMAKQVQLVLLVHKALPVHKALLVQLAQEVNPALRVQPEQQVLPERQVPLVPLVRLELQEVPGAVPCNL